FIDGATTFELYDTFGFPFDLTKLVASEKGLSCKEEDFDQEMAKQKARSRAAAETGTSEWTILDTPDPIPFLGYDNLSVETQVLMYRQAEMKKKLVTQVVLAQTPFYAESGGQVGDKGTLQFGEEQVAVYDTKKENELIVHFVNKMPADIGAKVHAQVNVENRTRIAGNHSATHLLHAALKEVLGDQVAQKGSYVGPDRLRFDFSHFDRISAEDLLKIERIANARIRENILKGEKRNVPIQEAIDMGATALFGEKYGDTVRVITFDSAFSRELCGGTHVTATGQIGALKILREESVAAGIRRIEAVTGIAAEDWMTEQLNALQEAKNLMKSPDLLKGIQKMQEESVSLKKRLEDMGKVQLAQLRTALKETVKETDGVKWITGTVDVPDADGLKQLSFELKNELGDVVLVLGTELDGKALLSIMIAESLVESKGWNAGKIIREAALEIQGGGGGQAFYATAGGKKPEGLQSAVQKAVELLGAVDVA
ncbi:MAG: alanyl-tRNA synthetase, partial [Limisphaerales bacterium]